MAARSWPGIDPWVPVSDPAWGRHGYYALLDRFLRFAKQPCLIWSGYCDAIATLESVMK